LLHENSARTDDDRLHFTGKIWGTKIYLYLFVVYLTTLSLFWYTVNVRALVNAVSR